MRESIHQAIRRKITKNKHFHLFATFAAADKLSSIFITRN